MAEARAVQPREVARPTPGAVKGARGPHCRKRRAAPLAAAGVAVMLCLGTALWRGSPVLVWNVSSSAPTGLYGVVAPARLGRGDYVVARLPANIARLAAARRYLPLGTPLVKRIAAIPGDSICANGSLVRIDGHPAARRRAADPHGRPMPWWNGCLRLRNGQYLLLTQHPWSFDGRYFGPTSRSEIIGRAVLLWAH